MNDTDNHELQLQLQQQLPLHLLLKEDQEPFHLKSYIADKRSKFKSPPKSTVQVQKRRRDINRGALCKHACFLSFHNSPELRKSPLIDFQSPSRHGAVLRIPTTTAAILSEAAVRIQKKEDSKAKGVGLGLFGSLLLKLKDKSRAKKRVNIINNEKKKKKNVTLGEVEIAGLEEDDDNNSIHLDLDLDLDLASSSSCCAELDFNSRRSYCVSPFRFSLCDENSSSSLMSGELSTPEFSSPCRSNKQETENLETRDSENVQGEEGEEKEQCSPVSVLDPPFEDYGHDDSGDAEEEEDSDVDCSYANVQRAKQQLLQRLRRFEKLAELDPMELERKLLEGSDSEDLGEIEESDNDEPLSQFRNQSVDTSLTELFNQSKVRSHSRKDIICLGRIYNKVDFHTIDTMIGSDFKRDFDGWSKIPEQRVETMVEIELAIFEFLMEEVSDELFCVHYQDSGALDSCTFRN